MPAPITICDSATYHETREDSAALTLDTVPLRNFLAMQEVAVSVDDVSTQRTHLNETSLSPRLAGYIFSCISCAVATISSAIFYFKETTLANSDTLPAYAESLEIILSGEQLANATERLDDMNDAYRLHFGSGESIFVMEVCSKEIYSSC